MYSFKSTQLLCWSCITTYIITDIKLYNLISGFLSSINDFHPNIYNTIICCLI